MNKIIIMPVIVTIIVIIAGFVIAFSPDINRASSDEKTFVWTKAVCNDDNYCIDVEVTCVGEKVAGIKPIPTGVYFSNDWEDPRPEEFKDSFC